MINNGFKLVAQRLSDNSAARTPSISMLMAIVLRQWKDHMHIFNFERSEFISVQQSSIPHLLPTNTSNPNSITYQPNEWGKIISQHSSSQSTNPSPQWHGLCRPPLSTTPNHQYPSLKQIIQKASNTANGCLDRGREIKRSRTPEHRSLWQNLCYCLNGPQHFRTWCRISTRRILYAHHVNLVFTNICINSLLVNSRFLLGMVPHEKEKSLLKVDMYDSIHTSSKTLQIQP